MVKDCAKNGVSKRAGRGWGRKEGNLPSPPPPPTFIFWLVFHFSRGQNRESCSSVFLCSRTKRKRLLRRLATSQRGIPLSNNEFSSSFASDSHILTYLTFLSFIAPYPPSSIPSLVVDSKGLLQFP